MWICALVFASLFVMQSFRIMRLRREKELLRAAMGYARDKLLHPTVAQWLIERTFNRTDMDGGYLELIMWTRGWGVIENNRREWSLAHDQATEKMQLAVQKKYPGAVIRNSNVGDYEVWARFPGRTVDLIFTGGTPLEAWTNANEFEETKSVNPET